MALTILLVAGSFLFGVGLTKSLMQPQYCPRCGAYMRNRGREVADWLLRRRQFSGEEKEAASREKM